jgi:cell wall assembly regulator SMI1
VLTAFEAQFQLELPEDFKLLYRWRNGQSPENFASLQDNRMWSSLEDITQTKDMLDGMIGTDFDDPERWQKSWLPFLSNGSGDHLCLNTRSGELIAFWHDWDDRSVEHNSLEDWLEALVQSAERGELEFF